MVTYFVFQKDGITVRYNVDNNLTLAVSLVLDEQEVPVETNIEWEEEDLDEEVPSAKPVEEEL